MGRPIRKAHREALKMLQAEGYEVIEHDFTHGSHKRFRVRKDGKEYRFVCPGTPGDDRWLKNLKGDLRKFGSVK